MGRERPRGGRRPARSRRRRRPSGATARSWSAAPAAQAQGQGQGQAQPVPDHACRPFVGNWELGRDRHVVGLGARLDPRHDRAGQDRRRARTLDLGAWRGGLQRREEEPRPGQRDDLRHQAPPLLMRPRSTNSWISPHMW